MKSTFLLITSMFVFSAAHAANDYQLVQLSCVASNGVKIETVKQIKDQNGQEELLVQTRLGLMTKNFVASMPVVSLDSATGIVLTPEQGPLYIVNLDMSPKVSEVQGVKGNLQILVNRYQAVTVAAVHCQVQVTEQ